MNTMTSYSVVAGQTRNRIKQMCNQKPCRMSGHMLFFLRAIYGPVDSENFGRRIQGPNIRICRSRIDTGLPIFCLSLFFGGEVVANIRFESLAEHVNVTIGGLT